MPLQKFEIPASGGQRLAALLDLPVDGAPIAYALFAHCFTCSKDLKAVYHISRTLTRERIGVLRFDFTGLGESGGDFADTSLLSNVQDLVAAAEFLAARFEAPQLLIGHSFGGAAVLQAAAAIPSSRAVVTIAAPADPRHVSQTLGPATAAIASRGEAEVSIAGRSFTLRRKFLDDLNGIDPESVIRNLNRALLVMHSPLDDVVGIENAARIFQTARHPKSFISLDQADHMLSNLADSRYAGAVIAAWARRYLAPPTPAIAERPATDNRIERDIEIEGPLDRDQRERLLQIADRCPVHRTLTSEVDIKTRLKE